jgi:hypothetical protein
MLPLQRFVDRQGTVSAAWLNEVDGARTALFDVGGFGAVADGVSECGPAIRAAWAACVAAGGGVLRFAPGIYAVNTLDPASPFSTPQQQADGSILYQPYQAALILAGGHDITMDFSGAVLTTRIVQGGAFMLFHGCQRLRLVSPTIRGTQLMSSGVTALAVTAGGSGYVNGYYNNVGLAGGSGSGATVGVTVAGGQVSALGILYPGGNYQVGDGLTAPAGAFGGSGSGFSATVTNVDGAGPIVKVAAPNAVCVVASNASPGSSAIAISDLNVTAMYSALYCTADPHAGATVEHLSLTGNTRAAGCEYGIALHNAGNHSRIENLYSSVSRPFFLYGVENVALSCVGDGVNFGYSPLVKAYSLSTRHLHLRYTALNQPGQSQMVPKVNFQVQGLAAVQGSVPVIESVYLDYAENNVVANGYGIKFDYLPDGTSTNFASSTALPLFDQFVIRGKMASTLQTTVALTGPPCHINADCLQRVASVGGYPPGLTVNAASGFTQLTEPL